MCYHFEGSEITETNVDSITISRDHSNDTYKMSVIYRMTSDKKEVKLHEAIFDVKETKEFFSGDIRQAYGKLAAEVHKNIDKQLVEGDIWTSSIGKKKIEENLKNSKI